MDILETREDGTIFLGNKKMSDRGSVMVIPGLNDSAIIHMGRLGMLKGAALKMYEKLRRQK